MNGRFYIGMAVAWGIIKGVTVAIVTLIIGLAFWQQFIVGVTSGLLGMFGVIAAAWITSHEARMNRELLADIKRRLSISKRHTDEGDE